MASQALGNTHFPKSFVGYKQERKKKPSGHQSIACECHAVEVNFTSSAHLPRAFTWTPMAPFSSGEPVHLESEHTHKCQILPSILQTGAACRQIFWRCRSAPFPCLSAFSSLLHFNSWGFILHLWETNFIICAILSETFGGGCIFSFNIIIRTPGSFGFSKKKLLRKFLPALFPRVFNFYGILHSFVILILNSFAD